MSKDVFYLIQDILTCNKNINRKFKLLEITDFDIFYEIDKQLKCINILSDLLKENK